MNGPITQAYNFSGLTLEVAQTADTEIAALRELIKAQQSAWESRCDALQTQIDLLQAEVASCQK